VVGVVHAAVAVEEDVRVGREDGVGPERPDLADEQLTQRKIVREGAVGLVEVGHALVADDPGGFVLLPLALGGQVERVAVGVLAAGVAARAAHEPADGARVEPARGGRSRPEVGVVGVGDDQHEPGRSPIVR
jgi:hypothetical protein